MLSKRHFFLGQNTDDNDRNLKDGEVRYAENIIIGLSDSATQGEATNAPGNSLQSFIQPPGTNTCVGTYYDTANERQIAMVYNSNGRHQIRQWYAQTGIVSLILESPFLNFSPDFLITGIALYNENLLYWTDNNNEPYKINITKALAYTVAASWYFTGIFDGGEVVIGGISQNEGNLAFLSSNTVPFIVGESIEINYPDPSGQTETIIATVQAVTNGGLGIITNIPFYVDVPTQSAGVPIVEGAVVNPIPAFNVVEINPIVSYLLGAITPINDVYPVQGVIWDATGYTHPFKQEFLYQIKPPDLVQPTCVYGTDESVQTNFLSTINPVTIQEPGIVTSVATTVDGVTTTTTTTTPVSSSTVTKSQKLFKFASRYIYDDKEISVQSPQSVIPLPTNTCSQLPNTDNYIEITVATGDEIVTKIEILGADVSDIVSDFYSIIVLDKGLLNIPSNSFHKYYFYNNQNYSAIDIDDSTRLFDNVPLKAKAEEAIQGNMLAIGNITENFNNIPIQADLDVTFNADVTIPYYTVTFKIFIQNIWSGNTGSMYNQSVNYNTNNGGIVAFGGVGEWQENTTAGDLGVAYGQILGLGGFVVYAAGTNYYAISSQNPNTYLGVSGAPLNSNAYNVTTHDQRRNVFGVAQEAQTPTNGQIYSTVTLTVPAGQYIFRVAGHNIQQSDIDSGDYQKTSTNVWQFPSQNINGVIGTTIGYDSTEGYFNVQSNLDLTSTPIFIADLSDVRNVEANSIGDIADFGAEPNVSNGYAGYVTGSDTDITTSPTTAQLLSEVDRIEESEAVFSNVHYPPNNLVVQQAALVPNSITINWSNGGESTRVDHNGFFFYSFIPNRASQSEFAPPNTFSTGTLNGFTVNAHTGSPLQVSGTMYSINGNAATVVTTVVANYSGRTLGEYILRNGSFGDTPTSDPIKFYARTLINGTVQNGGGLAVLVTHGRFQPIEINGAFSIYAYGNFYSVGNNERKDFVLFESTGTCSASVMAMQYPIPFDVFLSEFIPPDTSPSYYNVNFPYPSPTQPAIVAFATLFTTSTTSWKRGCVIPFGIVYYDHGIRSGATNTFIASAQVPSQLPQSKIYTDGLNALIPFFTGNGVTPNVGQGSCQISFNIYNSPPSWAKCYQWVRGLRNITFDLQWTSKTITFLDGLNAVVSPSEGVKIAIDLYSLATTGNGYKAQNPSSIITYDWSQGDRIRFISQANGTLFPQSFDREILGSDDAFGIYINNDTALALALTNATTDIGIPGFLFEIYSPRATATVEEFYEFGETYGIGTDANGNLYHEGGTVTTVQGVTNTDQQFYRFTDNLQIAGQLTLAGVLPSTINVGDAIYINQDEGFINASYNGLTTIIAITATNFTVNKPFGQDSPPNPGWAIIPARGTFGRGDVYMRLRNIPFDSNPADNILDEYNTPPNSCNASKLWYIEDPSFSDFYLSSQQSIGRPNVVDALMVQQNRITTIYYTGEFIPETEINRLNVIDPAWFMDYDQRFGSIQKLDSVDRYLDIYQEIKTGSIPINFNEIKNATGESTLIVTDTILNPVVYYDGEFGIGLNPESWAKWGYRRYFIDPHRAVALRLSKDGMIVISDYKMHAYFKAKFERLSQFGRTNIFGGFDLMRNQYIVAFAAAGIPPNPNT